MSPLALRRLTLLPGILNWSVWWFMVVLIGSQFLGIVWDTTKSTKTSMIGANIADGPAPLAGFNDRTNTMTLQPEVADGYTRSCDRIDYTLEAIQNGCQAMGYNVTRDALRIVVGVDGTTTQEITRALPVLMMPFYDSATFAAYMIPTTDGSVCIFSLNGMYQSPTYSYATLRAVPKSNRERMLPKWLNNTDGIWHNGWYEAPDGQRWYSNSMTSGDASPYDIELLDMDLVFATNGSRFGLFMYESTTRTTTRNYYSLDMFISNLSDFVILLRWLVSLGSMLFSYYHGVSAWDTTGIGSISSSRAFNLLPITMLPKLKLTLCAFCTVGCHFEGAQSALASAWYIIYPSIIEFMLLYYSLLNAISKLSYRRMSDALFGPTLVCLCALHYFRQDIARSSWAGINQRVSTVILSSEVDALRLPDFLTTNVAMRLHGNIKSIFYIKVGLLAPNLVPLLLSENMTEKRGKRARAFSPCDIEPVLALRASHLGGLGRSEVYANREIVVARIRLSTTESILPFASSRESSLRKTASMPSHSDLSPAHAVVARVQTKASAVQVIDAKFASGPKAAFAVADHVLIGYEMNRLGYLVYGGQFLLPFDDWYILTSLAPMRVFEKLWNYRIIVFDVARDSDGTYRILGSPRLCRLDDPELRVIPFYQITLCAFQ